MKALRLYGRDDVRLEDVPTPSARPGWSVVEVDWAAICASDLKEYQYLVGVSHEPNPITGVSLPLTLGHEFMGRVAETVSPDGLAVGTRVVVDGCIRDETCWYCRHGDYVMCDRGAILGFTADGCFAERILVPDYTMYELPDSIGDRAGALVEPLAVAVHAVRRSGLAAGDVVAIVGGGMIGLATLAVARAAGASAVYLVERMPKRRAKALQLGATAVFDPADGDPSRRLQDATRGHGADIAFDCVGLDVSLDSALGLARKGGRVVAVGVFKDPPRIDMDKISLGQRQLIGSLAYVDDLPRAIALAADGRVDLDAFITGEVALADIVEGGFQTLIDNPDEHVRIVVDTHAV